MKKLLFGLLIFGFSVSLVYAAPEEALKDPRGNKSLLGEYNSETKRIVVNADGHVISGGGPVSEDAASTANPLPMGGIAESTVKTEVADGDAVGLDINTFGRQRMAGYNNATGAVDVTVVSGPSLTNHTWNVGSATLDDSPTSLTSNTVSLGSFRNGGFLISYDETDTGNDTQIAVTVDVSDDNSTWYESSFIAGGSLVATVAMGSDSGTDDENFHVYLDEEAVGAPYVRCVLTCTGCAGGGDDQAAVSIEFTGQK